MLELDILIAILVLDIDTYLIDFVCVFQYFKFSIHLSLTLRRRILCIPLIINHSMFSDLLQGILFK